MHVHVHVHVHFLLVLGIVLGVAPRCFPDSNSAFFFCFACVWVSPSADNPVTGALILAGMLVCSPIAAFMAVVGSGLGEYLHFFFVAPSPDPSRRNPSCAGSLYLIIDCCL